MTNQHLIAPPPELVEEWGSMLEYHPDEKVFSEVAQWGADQQLAKDAEWLDYQALNTAHLRIIPVGEALKKAMRPKPPSLKEQALAVVENALFCDHLNPQDEAILRRALEALPND